MYGAKLVVSLPQKIKRCVNTSEWNTCLTLNLPTHMVVSPFHVPLDWQVLLDDPVTRKPGSHLNSILLGNTVESPKAEPFIGTGKGPQSTAESLKQKRRLDLERNDE